MSTVPQRPDAPAVSCIGEKYDVVRPLGEGGMGAVYEARHCVTGKRVAIKRMNAIFAGDPVAVQRFVRESQAATAIEHPNVVEIFDVGVEQGTPFMVMAYLEGRSLADHMAEIVKLDPNDAFDLLAPILEALSAAHALGIVHRDLKPDNIFLACSNTGGVTPKLLDFGISKFGGAEDARLTRTGTVMGTPSYMSPEQAAGESTLDTRSDVYSMGVILYECLSGRVPFEADNYNALVMKIVLEPPPSLAALRPDVSPELVAAIESTLGKKRESRPESMLDLHDALARALGRPLHRRSVLVSPDVERAPRAAPTRSGVSQKVSAFDATMLGESVHAADDPTPARSLSRAWSGAMAAIVAAAAIAIGVASSRSDPRDAPQPTRRASAVAALAHAPEDAKVGSAAASVSSSRYTRARLCAEQGLDRCVLDLLLGQASTEPEYALLVDTLVRLDDLDSAREQARRYRALFPRGPRAHALAALAEQPTARGAQRMHPASPHAGPRSTMSETPPEPPATETVMRSTERAQHRAGSLSDDEF